MSEASAVSRTTPPGRYVVLYDGHCRFCAAQAQRLLRWAGRNALDLVSFQDPGALDRFPEITHAACMAAMHLITPDGRVFRGFEAAVRALATRPVLGQIAWLYYVPGIRQLCDWIYRRIAANRYRLMGKAIAAGECAEGTCRLHVPKR